MVGRSDHAFAVLDLFIRNQRKLFARSARHRHPANPLLAELNAEIPLFSPLTLIPPGQGSFRNLASIDRASGILNFRAAMNQSYDGNRRNEQQSREASSPFRSGNHRS